MRRARFVYDHDGTPGIVAASPVDAFWGLGVLHAKHRPLQSMLLFLAGRASLAKTIAPRPDLVAMDAMVHRLDLIARAERASGRLDERCAERIDAYLAGFVETYRAPLELRLLLAEVPRPDRVSVLSGFLLSAYLGLAEGQERMERLLLEALHHGAAPSRLERMFRPHLSSWSPEVLRSLDRVRPPLGFSSRALWAVGGSNAWAVDGSRSSEGRALLAGDPHLPIGQMPSLFFEVGVRLPDDYWIGGTVPGLPSIAVGRNRNVAWSGTFAVADNVDAFVEHDITSAAKRARTIERRGLPPTTVTFADTDRGVLDRDTAPALAIRWTGCEAPEETITAYFGLLEARSVVEAERALLGAHTLSLHFVLADRAGAVRYVQVGRIPRRTGGWSGLHPSHDPSLGWDGRYAGDELPRTGPIDGVVLTANEARPAPDGGTLSTFGLAPYRPARIRQLLTSRRDHDVRSFARMQLDLYSTQAKILAPRLCAALPDGSLKRAIEDWDQCYDRHSRGAHAFEVAYRAALHGLSPELGGAWFEDALRRTEASVWWSTALDRTLTDDDTWNGPLGASIRERLAAVADARPSAWGDVQQFELKNLILGGLPGLFGFDRGPFPLPGSTATIQQGNNVNIGDATLPVGPAYRFVTDLGEDCAYTSLPGGIDGGRFSDSYDRWLADHLDGRHHRLVPPPP